MIPYNECLLGVALSTPLPHPPLRGLVFTVYTSADILSNSPFFKGEGPGDKASLGDSFIQGFELGVENRIVACISVHG